MSQTRKDVDQFFIDHGIGEEWASFVKYLDTEGPHSDNHDGSYTELYHLLDRTSDTIARTVCQNRFGTVARLYSRVQPHIFEARTTNAVRARTYANMLHNAEAHCNERIEVARRIFLEQSTSLHKIDGAFIEREYRRAVAMASENKDRDIANRERAEQRACHLETALRRITHDNNNKNTIQST